MRGEELTDDIVEMCDTLGGRVFSDTEEELVAAKAAQAQACAEGARLFGTGGTILLDPAVPPAGVRASATHVSPYGVSNEVFAQPGKGGRGVAGVALFAHDAIAPPRVEAQVVRQL